MLSIVWVTLWNSVSRFEGKHVLPFLFSWEIVRKTQLSLPTLLRNDISSCEALGTCFLFSETPVHISFLSCAKNCAELLSALTRAAQTQPWHNQNSFLKTEPRDTHNRVLLQPQYCDHPSTTELCFFHFYLFGLIRFIFEKLPKFITTIIDAIFWTFHPRFGKYSRSHWTRKEMVPT